MSQQASGRSRGGLAVAAAVAVTAGLLLLSCNSSNTKHGWRRCPKTQRVDCPGADPAFGQGGWTALADPGTPGNLVVSAVAVDAAGRTHVGGSTRPGNEELAAVWRVLLDGSLDPTFGVGGLVAVPRPPPPPGTNAYRGAFIRDLDLGVAGEIRAAGGVRSSNGDDIAAWRFDATGALDPSFATGGTFVHDPRPGVLLNDAAECLRVDGGRRIYLAGWTGSGEDSIIIRLDSRGAPDPTFGTGGVAILDLSQTAMDDSILDVDVDSRDRAIVAGMNRTQAWGRNVFVARIDEQGVLDPSFATAGVFLARTGNGGGAGLRVDAADRITLAGVADIPPGSIALGVWRLDPNGNLDPTFGTAGRATFANPSPSFGLTAVTGMDVDPMGRIAVSGYATCSLTVGEMFVLRLEGDGAPDGAFGCGGSFVHSRLPKGAHRTAATAVAADRNRGTVFVGTSWPQSSGGDGIVWRLAN